MQHHEWLAVRIMLERHQLLLTEAERARSIRSRRPARRVQARRHLASIFVRLAEWLDPERTHERTSGRTAHPAR